MRSLTRAKQARFWSPVYFCYILNSPNPFNPCFPSNKSKKMWPPSSILSRQQQGQWLQWSPQSLCPHKGLSQHLPYSEIIIIVIVIVTVVISIQGATIPTTSHFALRHSPTCSSFHLLHLLHLLLTRPLVRPKIYCFVPNFFSPQNRKTCLVFAGQFACFGGQIGSQIIQTLLKSTIKMVLKNHLYNIWIQNLNIWKGYLRERVC